MATLDINVPAGCPAVRVFHGDRLMGRIDLGIPSEPKDWEAELSKARAAQTACSWLRNLDSLLDNCGPSGKKDAAAAFAGFRLGLAGESQVIGHGEVASHHAPEHKLSGPAFSDGWRLGRALWAALALADGEKDPRR